MAPIIYRRQQEILEFLSQYIQKNGYGPTLRMIADALGLSSLATVHEHLTAMEEKGLIKRKPGKNRTIEIVKKGQDILSPRAIEAPILGFIAAGQPIEPYTDPHAAMQIPPSFVTGKKRVYVLQVRGDSMIEEQIRDGDYVVVEYTETARDGEIVVALLENGMATLKRYFREATRIRLEPANSTMTPIFAKNVSIQGRMVGLIRRYVN